MKTSRLSSMVGSILLLAVGCGGGNSDPESARDPNNTPPTTPTTPSTNTTPNSSTNSGACQNGQHQCSGMNLMVCKNGSWATDTCDFLCKQSGFASATSCKHDASLGYDACFCATSDPGACQQGAQKCNGLNLSICQAGAWSTATCDFLCQQAGYGKATACSFDSSKGTDTCVCDAPPSCTEGAQKCSGSTGLSVCQGGAWKTQSCNDLCQLAGYGMAAGCTFDASKGSDTCACFNGVTGDPCATNTHCKSGNICNNAGWCTKACGGDGECGKSTLGNANFCMGLSGGGAACFPWCASNSACAAFPGTICQLGVYTMDNTLVDGVCATP